MRVCLWLMVTVLVFASCGGDNSTEVSPPDPPDIDGTWSYDLNATGEGWHCYLPEPTYISVRQAAEGNISFTATSQPVWCDNPQEQIYSSGAFYTGNASSESLSPDGDISFDLDNGRIRNEGEVRGAQITGDVELIGRLNHQTVRLTGTFEMVRQ